MLQIIINNKIFRGEFIETDSVVDNRIKIDLTTKAITERDILFFANWQNKVKANMTKKSYAKDLKFFQITKSGYLINSFPRLSENEDYVTIFFDYKKIDENHQVPFENYNIKLEMPNLDDLQTAEWMKNWIDVIEKKESKKDFWVETPIGKVLNPKLVLEDTENSNEINITIKYDKIKNSTK